MDNFSSFPSGPGSGQGIADANFVAYEEKQQKERALNREQELAVGAVAAALMQELLGAFQANERAKEIRSFPGFKELLAELSTAIMQQTNLPLAEALQGMHQELFEKFLRGGGLTIAGAGGIRINIDVSLAEPLIETVKEKYFK